MRKFKKVNRGLMLTLCVLIAVAVYLAVLSSMQNAEKPQIKNVCEQYLQTEIKYEMLPKEYRSVSTQMPKDEAEKYEAQMEKDIKAFCSDGQTLKIKLKSLRSGIESQAEGQGKVISFEKKIKDIKYTFDKDSVEVEITSDSTYEGPNSNGKLTLRGKVKGETTDSIILQKKDGKWKVVYSDIQKPNQNSDGGMNYAVNY